MQIELHNAFQNPVSLEATRIVIKDQNGNPIAYAVQTDNGTIVADTLSRENSADFHRMLRNLGITTTTMVTDLKQKPVNDIVIP